MCSSRKAAAKTAAVVLLLGSGNRELPKCRGLRWRRVAARELELELELALELACSDDGERACDYLQHLQSARAASTGATNGGGGQQGLLGTHGARARAGTSSSGGGRKGSC